MKARTDRHNNPTAFTTALAKQAGLELGVEYSEGDLFTVGAHRFRTARLLGDPVAITRKLIDAVGFYTKHGAQRWAYIAIPQFVWRWLTPVEQARVIGFMYQHEGGKEMLGLFPPINGS